jgi:hypothetical protein
MSDQANGDEQPRRTNPRTLLGVAAAVVALATLGATGGWLLAGSDNGDNQADRGGTPTPFEQPTTRQPPTAQTTQPDGRASASTSLAAGSFALPSVLGVDFRVARAQLRGLKLGVQVSFGQDGADGTVVTTNPKPGEVVRAGITVRLKVAGDAPEVVVPPVLGMDCGQAGQAIADKGLEPKYKPSKAGKVLDQDPQPGDTAEWNETVTLYCGTPTSAAGGDGQSPDPSNSPY